MSRRASFFARQHPGVRRVRFPDEVVFEESIKEADGEAIMAMLRRASVDIDVNRINMAGMTALHQAVLDDNLVVVRLLLLHGARIDQADADSWTPLHAASANGHSGIVRYLLSQGADPDLLTEDGETAFDLVEEDDARTLAALLGEDEEEEEEGLEEQGREEKKEEKSRRVSLGAKEPAWVRKLSQQEDEKDTRRKGSAWVGREEIVEEESEEEEEEEEWKGCDKEEGGSDRKDNGGSAVIEEVHTPGKEEKISVSAVCENAPKGGAPHLTVSIRNPAHRNEIQFDNTSIKSPDSSTFRRLESYETETSKANSDQKVQSAEEFLNTAPHCETGDTKKEGGTEKEPLGPIKASSDNKPAFREEADSKKPLEAGAQMEPPGSIKEKARGGEDCEKVAEESNDGEADKGEGVEKSQLEKSGSWRQRRRGMAEIPSEGLIQHGVRKR